MRNFLKITAVLAILLPAKIFCQSLDTLTVEKIMRDPKWIGTSPSNPFWNVEGTRLFFDWNPENAPSDSLYYISKENLAPKKATPAEKADVVGASQAVYNLARTAYVYTHNADVFYHDNRTGKTVQVTAT